MAHLTLNCPTCRRRLTYVPLDGLTLHYHCEEHGLLIFRPLRVVALEDSQPASSCDGNQFRAHDAA